MAVEDAGTPDLILIGTGTELDLCVQAAGSYREGNKVRVVSMPCVELFDEQSDTYKEEVLPNAVRKRMVVEAAILRLAPFHRPRWRRVTMNRWRFSSGWHVPERVRLHRENVVAKAKALLG